MREFRQLGVGWSLLGAVDRFASRKNESTSHRRDVVRDEFERRYQVAVAADHHDLLAFAANRVAIKLQREIDAGLLLLIRKF